MTSPLTALVTPPPESKSSGLDEDKGKDKSNDDKKASSFALFWLYIAPLYVAWRIFWANRLPIMDCDEVYNYWEPLHFWLYKQGMQTWEYANVFALRTYAYLAPLYIIAQLYRWTLVPLLTKEHWWIIARKTVMNMFWKALVSAELLVHDTYADSGTESVLPTDAVAAKSSQVARFPHDKLALFFLLRATLAAGTAMSEIYMCQSLAEYVPRNGTSAAMPIVGLVTLFLLLTSCGMSHSSAALLPSSTITMLWCIAAGAFLRRQSVLVAFIAIVATLAVGWPFGMALFVPFGLAVLWWAHQEDTKRNDKDSGNTGTSQHESLMCIVKKIIVITLAIQVFVMAVDYYHYGRLLSPNLNILLYNAQNGGDELYGVEPLSYYIQNLFLNLNLVTVVGLLAIPVALAIGRRDVLVLLSPLYVWMLLVFPRPHKEERFLFPIYPILCIGSAIVGVTLVDEFARRIQKQPTISFHNMLYLQLLLWTPSAFVSYGRTMALQKYYSAPLVVFSQLPFSQLTRRKIDSPTLLCTCGEWYRYPSSFFLPPGVSLGYVQSSFEGQLPAPFSEWGSKVPPPSRAHPAYKFNDRNKQEMDRYVEDMDENCDLLVDLASSTSCRDNDSIWTPVAHAPFLQSAGTLHRAVYIPFLHERAEQYGSVVYDEYVLYEKKPKLREIEDER